MICAVAIVRAQRARKDHQGTRAATTNSNDDSLISARDAAIADQHATPPLVIYSSAHDASVVVSPTRAVSANPTYDSSAFSAVNRPIEAGQQVGTSASSSTWDTSKYAIVRHSTSTSSEWDPQAYAVSPKLTSEPNARGYSENSGKQEQPRSSWSTRASSMLYAWPASRPEDSNPDDSSTANPDFMAVQSSKRGISSQFKLANQYSTVLGALGDDHFLDTDDVDL